MSEEGLHMNKIQGSPRLHLLNHQSRNAIARTLACAKASISEHLCRAQEAGLSS